MGVSVRLPADPSLAYSDRWCLVANQFHELTNLIYLGTLTGRVAIIHPLQPIHIDPPVWARLSDFFDLDRFTRDTGIPLVEFADLKMEGLDTERESIGCFSLMEVNDGPGKRLRPNILSHINVNIESYPFPKWFSPRRGYREVTFRSVPMPVKRCTCWVKICHFNSALQDFDFHVAYKEDWVTRLVQGTVADALGERWPPDATSSPPRENLFCLDNTFMIFSPSFSHEGYAVKSFFGEERSSWTHVGHFLHFNDRVDAILDAIMMELFGRADQDFIGVHVRGGDIPNGAGIERYGKAVERIRIMLAKKDGRTGLARYPNSGDLPVFVGRLEPGHPCCCSGPSLRWQVTVRNQSGKRE